MLNLIGIPVKEEINQARIKGIPLILAPATIPRCNFKCFYCYVDVESKGEPSLTFGDHLSVIKQVKEMGTKYVIIGMEGEPLLDPSFYSKENQTFPIIDAANEHGLHVVTFTNMSLLTPEILSVLKSKKVSLVGKLNSMNYETNEKLVGVPEIWEKYGDQSIPKGLKLMLDAGFNESRNADETRLGIDIIVSALNYKDIPEVVKFALRYNIKPIVDSLIPTGRADKNYRLLKLTKPKNEWLYMQLKEILGEEFIGEEFVEGCAIKEGVAYDSKGNVMVCCTLGFPVGNIKKESIQDLYRKTQAYREIIPNFKREPGVINSCKVAKYVQLKSRTTFVVDSKAVKMLINKITLDKFMDEVINRIEFYFEELKEKKLERIPRYGFKFGNHNIVEAMLGRRRNSKICGKIVSYHDTNFDRGLPTVMSTTVIVDENTGFLEVISESSLLTYIRTGAVNALAAKYLAKKDIKRIGFIGTGSIAQLTLHALSRILQDLEIVYAWDKDDEACHVFKRRMEKLVNISIIIERPEEFARKVEVINVATYGNDIVLKYEWIEPGLHINAIGTDTPGKQELDVEILKRSKIIVDYKEQALKEGELNVPLAKNLISEDVIHAEFPEIVTNQKRGRVEENEITIFDSTGDPLEDMAVLDLFLEYNDKLQLIEPSEFVLNLNYPKDPCGYLFTERDE